MDIRFSVEQMVMQPTQFCNLNCGYCYLPDRGKNRKMPLGVAKRVVDGIAELGTNIELTWHGGEPLSCGLDHFSTLISAFDQLQELELVHHVVQTNATLINERWCEFFRSRNFKIGVSIDGPIWANVQRVDWLGKPSFDKITRGIDCLRTAKIPFSVICVVNKDNLHRAQELYEFFVKLGCDSLGINVEEKVGAHTADVCDDGAKVTNFWRDLFFAWLKNPVIRLRDFSRMLPLLSAIGNGNEDTVSKPYDIFPSIAWNGDVVLLAPEFLNASALHYDNFVIGNVLNEKLCEIIKRGEQSAYVRDFTSGINRCRKECECFPICYGGQAGNKFFEHGTTDATETVFCRNSEKRLADAILQVLN